MSQQDRQQHFSQHEVELFNPKRDIVYEDEYCFVVNKAAGLVAHRNHEDHDVPALADYIAAKVSFPRGDLKGGIVHRLDKDTSGILICAKNEASKEAFSALFKKRAVTKRYTALASGLIYEGVGSIVTHMARDPKQRTKRRVVPSHVGRYAQTHYEALEFFTQKNPSTLVSLRIVTGRTHQIRVHFAHIGYPILGDRLYAPKNHAMQEKHFYLFAQQIMLTHPFTHKILDVKIPQPDFFQEKISALRTQALAAPL